MPDIFDEVEEDLRAERGRRLLARYGGLLGAALLLVVLGVAGLEGWRWWQARQSATAALSYLTTAREAAAPNADGKAAADRFAALAAEAPAGYRTLAALRAAALKAEAGERDQALALWDSVARDRGTPAIYR
ncbi:MAG TPA: tetratricopeptide repeat protein, partial [Crenalkalicoccus sp.]|nr:tetratricopeptide repeat protein [Crenalkalicoccus sp.]